MAGKTIRRAALAAVLAAVAGLVLPPFINVSRYKNRVVHSMSQALGRPVTCGSLELRLLPQPGFSLADVTIGDDPAFSAEPILYADNVTAYLSVRSLWRGHMEFSRLVLDYPSLNLVEGPRGGWNLESVLWKASQAKTAPTGAGHGAARPRFPYVEASHGRINFKYGLAKSVFSFVDANFSLWSPAEGQWQMRLEARPVRTDMPVTDTGVVKADLAVRRAPLLRDAPLHATFSWENVQMGNLTRLLSGRDRGWRGEMQAHGQLSGTPEALHFSTSATLRDLRRYDVIGGETPKLQANCQGVANLVTKAVADGECRLPLDGGTLAVEGAVSGLRTPRYDLTLSGENLGAATLLNLARRAKHRLPHDLTAAGTISASFHVSRPSDAPSVWIGNLEINSLKLHSAVLGKDLGVERISAEINTSEPEMKRRHLRRVDARQSQRALQLRRFRLPLGGSTPAEVDGSVDLNGFALHVTGDATLERLQQVTRALGIGAPKLSLAGAAAVHLTVGGSWSSFDSPPLSGTARLKDVRAAVPGLAAPVKIASGRVVFEGQRFTVQSTAASIGRIELAGSASFLRSCGSDSPCLASFALDTDDLNLQRWNQVLNPHLKKRPWYFFGGGGSGENVMARLDATGTLRARRLVVPSPEGGAPVTGSAFATSFSLARGVLRLSGAHAELFGGRVSGDWTLDWGGREPRYEGSGTATRIKVEKLAPLLGASPGNGTVSVEYQLQLRGEDEASLRHSATAEAEFHWRGGWLRLSPDGRGPLRLRSGDGTASLGASGWTIRDSRWRTPRAHYRLSGTISRASALDLKFTASDGSTINLGGTLSKPRVVAPTVPARRRAR